MDPVERLLAIEDIKRLKASYCRYLDTKNWEEFAACFTQDGVFDHGGGQGAVQGAAEISASVCRAVGDIQLVHHALMPEIEVISSTTATATWGLDDMLLWPDGRRSLHAYGHYHETYERVEGRWKIKLSQVSQLRVDTSTVTSAFRGLPGPA
jgi:SnoaL-like domain